MQHDRHLNVITYTDMQTLWSHQIQNRHRPAGVSLVVPWGLHLCGLEPYPQRLRCSPSYFAPDRVDSTDDGGKHSVRSPGKTFKGSWWCCMIIRGYRCIRHVGKGLGSNFKRRYTFNISKIMLFWFRMDTSSPWVDAEPRVCGSYGGAISGSILQVHVQNYASILTSRNCECGCLAFAFAFAFAHVWSWKGKFHNVHHETMTSMTERLSWRLFPNSKTRGTGQCPPYGTFGWTNPYPKFGDYEL